VGTKRALRGVVGRVREAGLALLSMAAGILLLGTGANGQEGYQKPPEAVLEMMNAAVTPRASVGRARDVVLLYSPEPYPSIADVAHGHSARESIEHTVWEMLTWFDKFVKNGEGDTARPATTAGQ